MNNDSYNFNPLVRLKYGANYGDLSPWLRTELLRKPPGRDRVEVSRHKSDLDAGNQGTNTYKSSLTDLYSFDKSFTASLPAESAMTDRRKSPPPDRRGFEIAIICALQTESTAVEASLDDIWDGEQYGKAAGDPNAYTVGRIDAHNMVLAYMPSMGTGAAANTAASLRSSFRNIQLVLLVGVCGGTPKYPESGSETEIILEDVVISTGVVQYQYERQFADRVTRKDTLKDSLSRPNVEIRALLHKMEGWSGR